MLRSSKSEENMQYSKIFNYKGLIFDLDGTLINSMPYHAKAWKQVANEHGFDIDTQDIYAMGGSSSLDIARHYKNLGFPVGDEYAYVQRKITIYKSNIEHIQIIKNTFEVLKEAKERGIKTAIGTGTRTENAHLILNKLDIAKYVDVLVTADDVKRHKPNPDTFEKAALKMDLKNYECLVFEDGQLGVRAAINGGFDCVEVKDDDFINYFEIDR